jgi:hypothetical protein
MSLLSDLLLELLGSGAGEPSTDRGMVARFSVGSVVLAGATMWLFVTSADPVRQPEWGVFVLIGSVLCGAGGVLVSLLHLRRNESDRPFGLVSLILNAAAIAIPLAPVIAR